MSESTDLSKWICRYRIMNNQEAEGYDIVDTESWTSRYEDRDTIVVATVYDSAMAAAIALQIEQMDLPRTIG